MNFYEPAVLGRTGLRVGRLGVANFFTERLFMRGPKSAGLDHADVLLLGYFSR